MTEARSYIGVFARPRRTIAAAALAALAALALTGCGSAELSSGKPGEGAASEPSATPSTPEQMAFTAMLDKLARSCTSPAGWPAHGPTDKKPTGSPGKQSLAPGESPPTDPIEPGAPTEAAAQLNDRDHCASTQHEQRIIQALATVSKPTPAKVRNTLNALGYIDEHIHGLKQAGNTTRFYLDLRGKGGRLCEAGVAAGVNTDVTVCAARATGSFTVQRTDENP
jgi:hypothetical protein